MMLPWGNAPGWDEVEPLAFRRGSRSLAGEQIYPVVTLPDLDKTDESRY